MPTAAKERTKATAKVARTTRPPRRRAPERDPVTRYALHVGSGKIIAGRLVRLACERHLRDLEEARGQPARGIYFDAERAQRAINFFAKLLRLTEGEFADKAFVLQPWQEFIVGSLFGWYNADGTRRFRLAFIEVAKGNGKSPMAAGIGLYGLIADDEPGAQIYSAAVVKDQAKILFTDAWNMVLASPSLDAHVERHVNNISVRGTKSYFRPVSSEHRGLEGKRVHMALIDEVHEHRTAIVCDKMREGTKGRRQALIFEITNSGFDRKSVCWQHHEMSVKVLTGIIPNDSWFAYVAQLDACESCTEAGHAMAQPDCETCDDWRDERTWVKANPNIEVSVTRKYIRELVAEAIAIPSKRNTVLRLNFCMWTQQVTKWLSMDKWRACSGRTPARELVATLRGRRCFAGLDLARVHDLSAFVKLFPPVEAGELWKVLCRFWVPQDDVMTRANRDNVPYDLWIEQGWIEATPGNTTDFGFIEKAIVEDASEFVIEELAYDRIFAGELIIALQQEGLELVPFGQGFLSMAAPTAELERLVSAAGLEHGGNPVLDFNAANVAVRQDAAGNIKPDKEHSTERIDGIVALVMALGRATVHNPTGTGISLYVPGEPGEGEEDGDA